MLSWYPFCDLSKHLLTVLQNDFLLYFELLAGQTTAFIVYELEVALSK